MLLDKTVNIPDLGLIGPDSGFHLLETTEDGKFISGKNGSGTIFFSGCSLRCVYCQNFEISHLGGGEVKTVNDLAEIMRELENRGAHNINFVNPTHYAWAIREALKIYKPNIPLVYNSGGYDSVSAIKEDIFDIYFLHQ